MDTWPSLGQDPRQSGCRGLPLSRHWMLLHRRTEAQRQPRRLGLRTWCTWRHLVKASRPRECHLDKCPQAPGRKRSQKNYFYQLLLDLKLSESREVGKGSPFYLWGRVQCARTLTLGWARLFWKLLSSMREDLFLKKTKSGLNECAFFNLRYKLYSQASSA